MIIQPTNHLVYHEIYENCHHDIPMKRDSISLIHHDEKTHFFILAGSAYYQI